MSLYDELKEIRKQISDMETRLSRALLATEHIRSAPIIQGYRGKRFDLNANMDAQNIQNKLDALDLRVSALE